MAGKRKTLLQAAAGAALCLLVTSARDVKAQFAGDEGQSCAVGVRMIGASNAPGAQAAALSESPFLADIAPQLRRLPFVSYRTLDFVEKKLRMNQRGKFVMQGAGEDEHYMVSVLPHAVMDGKVYLTVDWEDGTGSRLMSTRMHVGDGKDLLVGAEGPSSASSTVLAVRAHCGTQKTAAPSADSPR